MKFRFWYIEAFLFFLLIGTFFLFPVKVAPEGLEFIPDVLNGLATMSGILSALIGYLITHIVPRIPDTPKRWIGTRIAVVIVTIGFGLLIIMVSFSVLIQEGNLVESFNLSMFGTLLIVIMFFEVMFMTFLRELEQKTNLSDEW